MNFTKPGRPGKSQLHCHFCKELSSPKNGDWYVDTSSDKQQFFACRVCQPQLGKKFKLAVLVR